MSHQRLTKKATFILSKFENERRAFMEILVIGGTRFFGRRF
jgi:hypothetical protein